MFKKLCGVKISSASVILVLLLLAINVLHCISFESTPIPSSKGNIQPMYSVSRTFRRRENYAKFANSFILRDIVERYSGPWPSSTSLNSSKEGETSQIKSNEYLVQSRLAAAAAKRESRRKSLEQDRERNLRLKRLIHSSSSSSEDASEGDRFPIPSLYAVRVSVDKILRDELRMNGREKRGRVFIEVGSTGATTIKGLRFELHAFFRSLKKRSYLLSAGLPKISESDGSILTPDENENAYDDFMPIEGDEDVVEMFSKAEKFFETHNEDLSDDAPNLLHRPSIILYVRKDPNAPKPPPPPSYLKDMANPKETSHMTMLSFYAFPADGGIQDPEEFAFRLRKTWKPFDALGRVYVAQEGVNAQMAIPTNV